MNMMIKTLQRTTIHSRRSWQGHFGTLLSWWLLCHCRHGHQDRPWRSPHTPRVNNRPEAEKTSLSCEVSREELLLRVLQRETGNSRIWSGRAAWWTSWPGCLWHCRPRCSTWTAAGWDWWQSASLSVSGWRRAPAGCRCRPRTSSSSPRSHRPPDNTKQM